MDATFGRRCKPWMILIGRRCKIWTQVWTPVVKYGCYLLDAVAKYEHNFGRLL